MAKTKDKIENKELFCFPMALFLTLTDFGHKHKLKTKLLLWLGIYEIRYPCRSSSSLCGNSLGHLTKSPFPSACSNVDEIWRNPSTSETSPSLIKIAE